MKAKFGVRCVVWATIASFCSTYVGAAPVSLANMPLVSVSTKAVPPNVFFVLDDSFSMNSAYMPDSVNDDNEKNCYRNHGYNSIYYNPGTIYEPPLKYDGTSYPNSPFTKAPNDGFNPNSNTTNLSTSFSAGSGSGSSNSNGAAYYYRYRADPDNPPSTCAGNNSYEIVKIAAADQQSFANWYSYYRSRLNMMKTAVSRAFVGVDDKYRVGFTTINETGTGTNRFLGNAVFNSTQKQNWYGKLAGLTIPNSPIQYTPLRGALSKAGRYYAGRLSNATDPMQYSCQKNFT
ncbi:MAG: hypothetical protein LBE59_05455, partial [Nevskiaceae bacterium]|nr:hypothetical protein [Nevskiaceae bacterium]